DRLRRELPRGAEHTVVRAPSPIPELCRREVREAMTTRLVEGVEVAPAEVVIARPRCAAEDCRDVLAGELVPVDDMGNVVKQRPVGSPRIRWRCARQPPRSVVEAR